MGLIERVRLSPGSRVRLADHDPSDKLGLNNETFKVGEHEMFDPRVFLTNVSKGVYRTPIPLSLLYSVYDPANVPAEVVASWGTEPLEPQTFVASPSQEDVTTQ